MKFTQKFITQKLGQKLGDDPKNEELQKDYSDLKLGNRLIEIKNKYF